jgi:hypothetical protein
MAGEGGRPVNYFLATTHIVVVKVYMYNIKNLEHK